MLVASTKGRKPIEEDPSAHPRKKFNFRNENRGIQELTSHLFSAEEAIFIQELT
jgi:hypothetical protein